tara:strand:- start:8 stop:286 length:279 start_codon:yes stop_codon:yes gene_type:complete
MKTTELIKLTNSLSNDDLIFIMNAFSDRICVYAGSYKRHAISFERVECCSNGCIIQINPKDLGQDSYDIEKHINKINESKKKEDKTSINLLK